MCEAVIPRFNKMNPDYCTVGKIVRPFGRRGEVKVVVMTDFPERFERRRRFFLEPPFEPMVAVVEGIRAHKDAFIVKFEGVESIEEAEKLVDKFVRIPLDELEPLEEGSYYWHQLEGLLVIDQERGQIGKVESVFRAGEFGNEVLVVVGQEGEHLVPMIEDVILKVDLDGQRIYVRLLEE